MKQERWEIVYGKINGACDEDECPNIRDESGASGLIGPLVEQVYGARDRLCERTGISPDRDPDMEQIVDGFEQLCRICSMLMYRYGQEEGKE